MDEYLKRRFETAYPLKIRESSNYTNLKPFICFIMELSEDYKEGKEEAIDYINTIQQDLYNKKVIPFIVNKKEDIQKIEKLDYTDTRKLLWHIWLIYK